MSEIYIYFLVGILFPQIRTSLLANPWTGPAGFQLQPTLFSHAGLMTQEPQPFRVLIFLQVPTKYPPHPLRGAIGRNAT